MFIDRAIIDFYLFFRYPNHHWVIISLLPQIFMVELWIFFLTISFWTLFFWIMLALAILINLSLGTSCFFHLTNLLVVVNPLLLKRAWLIIRSVCETHVTGNFFLDTEKFSFRKHMNAERLSNIEWVLSFSYFSSFQA